MTPLDKLTEAVAVTYASGVAGIVGRHPEHAVEVCRFHREGADESLAAIQAALPEGHYLGREGVVRTKVRTYCASHGSLHTGWGGWTATVCPNGIGCAPFRLHAIEPVEADQ